MNLEQLRTKMNDIDDHMMDLFKQRMGVSIQIGDYKRRNNIAVFDSAREAEILKIRKEKLANDTLWPYYEAFLKEIMRLSKEVQT
jgi:monofunctional chorismate mutase